MICVPEKPHYTSERSEQQFYGAFLKEPVFVMTSAVVHGSMEFGPTDGVGRTQFALSSHRVVNYAIYESGGTRDVKVHCTTQKAL